jgi:hypothetical protein
VAAHAVAEGGEEAGGDARPPAIKYKMRPTQQKSHVRNALILLLGVAVSASLFVTTQSQSAFGARASQVSTPSQKTFATPEQAADALIQAASAFDVPALNEILGPEGKDLVATDDTVRDKNNAAAFAAISKEKHSISRNSKTPARAVLLVGNNDWPMPIPIVKQNGRWLFDTKAGRQEILLRRIGSNELDAIQICRGYVEAQHEYALQRHDNSEVNQYAQRIVSSPGKHDGLAWKNTDGSWSGPVGEGIAEAIQKGYTARSQPYHGYYFKILKGQGPTAPLGQMDFVVKGAMIGGFALAAAPADYRVTGVKTFVVSYEGVVYQKDLGPGTLDAFKAMELYNPDKSWQRTEDNW